MRNTQMASFSLLNSPIQIFNGFVITCSEYETRLLIHNVSYSKVAPVTFSSVNFEEELCKSA